MELQPCDWHERDVKKKYVVDVYGRLAGGETALVRVTGFRPFFYVGGSASVAGGVRVSKYDVMSGFTGKGKIVVWKVMCESLSEFHEKSRALADEGRTLYESNLPPFLRLIHSQHLGPGSPFTFVGSSVEIPTKDDEPDYVVDHMFTCTYSTLAACDAMIPLKVASYDLEMYSESGRFPTAKGGDPIIQIGVSFRWSNDLMTPLAKYVFVLGKVDPSDDPSTTFVGCKTESDVLLAFRNCVIEENPDILCGYNTFGFDDPYIEDRCRALGLFDPYAESSEMNMSRAPFAKKNIGRRGCPPRFVNKFTDEREFELASGKYQLRNLALRGRLGLDLLLNMRREHSLDSFKLDSVASVFLRDKVVSFDAGLVKTKSTRGLCSGNYVRFDIAGNAVDSYQNGRKCLVHDLTPTSFRVDPDLFSDLTPEQRSRLEWTFTKDDVNAPEMFRLHREGGPAGRARIAKYCIQDCDLVLTLMAKLDTLVNARGMADVCRVPMQFVLTRGQGIKIFSAVVYYAAQRDQIIQVQESLEDDTSYEGAIVIPPKIGMYLDQPISVLDFNSLYPSNMIAYNLSPDTLVSRRVYDDESNVVAGDGEGLSREEIAALEDKGYKIDEIQYTDKITKHRTVCKFVQPRTDMSETLGILPKTLGILLAKRKEYKTKMEDMAYDESQRSVFNGLQLAYKVVANSVYGQTGAPTSPIRKLCVAACTTAAGRDQLYFAKRVVEEQMGAQVVYGDTDSIFVMFPTKSLTESIRLGLEAGKKITQQIGRAPYKIAYEKTFHPFILFCRKRYVGIKYEEDPTKGKRMSMGIVLKRRDNAPIVKEIFGGALDTLLQGGADCIPRAQAYVKSMLRAVLDNKVSLDKFIVSKSLRDDYKNPEQIAHRVLADRMASRDPGTAPKVGDRVPYIYVVTGRQDAKQGDRIEDIDYVRANRLEPDTRFYITNQIQNPVAQLFALCIEKLDGYVEPRPSYASLFPSILAKSNGDEEDATLCVLAKKEKQLDELMFLRSPYLSNQKTLTSWLKK